MTIRMTIPTSSFQIFSNSQSSTTAPRMIPAMIATLRSSYPAISARASRVGDRSMLIVAPPHVRWRPTKGKRKRGAFRSNENETGWPSGRSRAYIKDQDVPVATRPIVVALFTFSAGTDPGQLRGHTAGSNKIADPDISHHIAIRIWRRLDGVADARNASACQEWLPSTPLNVI